MTRKIARFAFAALSIILICFACGALLQFWLGMKWIIGLGGALGAMTYRPATRLFDRLWPGLPAGWAK